MGMANVPPRNEAPLLPADSALLKCEHCGSQQRVWLNRCKKCADPEDNWYERRIATLEAQVQTQDALIRKQADQLNNYSMKLRRLEGNDEGTPKLGP